MKKISLECGCQFHRIDIEEFMIDKFKLLSIAIYEHKSQKTGMLLKKSKLLADVVLNPDEYKKLKERFINA